MQVGSGGRTEANRDGKGRRADRQTDAGGASCLHPRHRPRPRRLHPSFSSVREHLPVPLQRQTGPITAWNTTPGGLQLQPEHYDSPSSSA